MAVAGIVTLLAFGLQSAFAQQSEKAAVSNSHNEKQKKKGDPRRGFFVFTGYQGVGTYSRSGLSDKFASNNLSQLYGGLRWQYFRVTAKGGGGDSSSDIFTDDFVSSSGYRRESLEANALSYSVLFGYDIHISRTLSIGPYVALEWLRIVEGSYSYVDDPHPNWNLDARSRSQPAVGLEFSYRGSLHNDAWTDREQRNFLLYSVGVQVSRVRYDNSEYGNGAIIQLYIGFGYEFRLFY